MRGTLNALFAGFMAWCMVDVAVQLSNHLEYEPSWWFHWKRQICVAMILLPVTLGYFKPRIMQPVIRLVRAAVVAASFSALWVVPELVHLAMIRQPQEDASKLLLLSANHPSAPAGSHPRIIWILFDELSYDQTFDHPAPGINLANFDRLQSESVSFSNLEPAGIYTELIIPSLFLGRRVVHVRATVGGDLSYQDENRDGWISYDPDDTLFGVAQGYGLSTAVDGWYNPYCHLLAPVLNDCFWEPSATANSQLAPFFASRNKSMVSEAEVLPKLVFAKVTSRKPPNAGAHVQEYRDLMARTTALIEDDKLDFIFLHLPVPHPPGIYDRSRHMLRAGGTYLDNLVLADDTMGVLLREIEANDAAARTTIIVSSDHSWRIPLWRPSAEWTREEESASRGRFDERPVLLIHFPAQHSANEVNESLPEMVEHDIIADMLRGRMNNVKELQAFLARR